jgi:hypothetical protein
VQEANSATCQQFRLNAPYQQLRDCKAKNSSDNIKILSIKENQEVHYRVYKTPKLIHILSQIYPVNTLPFILLSIILILPFHLRLGLPTGFLLQVLTLTTTVAHGIQVLPHKKTAQKLLISNVTNETIYLRLRKFMLNVPVT